MQHVVPLQEGTVWVPLAQPCTGLSSRKWGSVYICVPVSILVHFANHEPSWTLVEKPLPLNRGRCIKVPGRYWCLRSCPRWCKHLLWPRPQGYSQTTSGLEWDDTHIIACCDCYDGEIWWALKTVMTQWWPSLLSDDHHYEVCWMWNELLIMVTIVTAGVPRNTQASFTSTSAPALLAKFMCISPTAECFGVFSHSKGFGADRREQLQNPFPQGSQVPSKGSQVKVPRFPSKGSQVPK